MLEAIKVVELFAVNGGPKMVWILAKYGVLQFMVDLSKSTSKEPIRLTCEECLKSLITAGINEMDTASSKKSDESMLD